MSTGFIALSNHCPSAAVMQASIIAAATACVLIKRQISAPTLATTAASMQRLNFQENLFGGVALGLRHKSKRQQVRQASTPRKR
jgi:hypothetical protein